MAEGDDFISVAADTSLDFDDGDFTYIIKLVATDANAADDLLLSKGDPLAVGGTAAGSCVSITLKEFAGYTRALSTKIDELAGRLL